MKFFRLGKQVRHQKFKFIPRFYDPDKEDLDRRLKSAKGEVTDLDSMKHRIQSGFSKRSKRKPHFVKNYERRSNWLVLIVFLLLLAITFYFLIQYLPRIIDTFQ